LEIKKNLKIVIFALSVFIAVLILIIAESRRTVPSPETAAIHFSYTDSDSQVPDFEALHNIPDKKKVFFEFMRPIIESENLKVLKKRQKVSRIFNKNRLSRIDTSTALNIAGEYGFTGFNIDSPEEREALLSRIDIIPVQLALVQSANETAWGTSRFARVGNNMFGQWCFTKGDGIVPENRDKGATHEVAKFTNINNSVASYLHNLNTGSSYQRLRELRQEMRLQNRNIDPVMLAQGLIKYSSLGEKYVKIIVSMIKSNEKYM